MWEMIDIHIKRPNSNPTADSEVPMQKQKQHTQKKQGNMSPPKISTHVGSLR